MTAEPSVPTVPPLKPESVERIKAGDPDLMRKAIARTWLALHPREDRAMAVEGSIFRHSWVAKCARQTRYEIEHREPSEPLQVESLWVFRVGQLIHDEIQPALEAMLPGVAHCEVSLPSMDVDGSCSLDVLWLFDDGIVITGEVKSLNGFGFKSMVGAGARKQGVRLNHEVQTCMNAHAAGQVHPGMARGAYLIVAALENLSVNVAAKAGREGPARFMEVVYFPQEHCEQVAQKEIARLRPILDAHAASEASRAEDPDEYRYISTPREIPDPEIPEGAVVTDPAAGRWELRIGEHKEQVLDAGTCWQCDYCNFRSLCIEEGP